jgi:hypothetical protein
MLYCPVYSGDMHVIDGKIVERFSQKDYLVYLQLRFPQFTTPIDLSAISSIETDPTTGSILSFLRIPPVTTPDVI